MLNDSQKKQYLSLSIKLVKKQLKTLKLLSKKNHRPTYDKNLKKCLENSQFTRFGGQGIMVVYLALPTFICNSKYIVSMTNMGFDVYSRYESIANSLFSSR